MTTSVHLPSRTSPRRRWIAMAGGALLLYGAASALGPALAVLALLTLVAVVAWRHPGWSAVVLVSLVPTNRFLILLVFHFGHSSALTSLAQLWKDLLIALLALRTLDDVILRRRPKLHYVDLLVAAFLLLSLLYLAYPGDPLQIGFLDRVIGFRADSYFVLAYFVGRGLALHRRHVQALLTWLVPGTVVTAVVAFAQFVSPNWFNDAFNRLGYSAFINTQSAFSDADVIRLRGISGANLPRASSLLLGDLALAFFSILAIAVGAALMLTSTGRRRLGYGAFTALAFAAMVLTLTRSAVLAATAMLLLMALVTRRWRPVTTLVGVLAIGGLVAMVTGFIPIGAVTALANPHEASVQAHSGAIQNGLTLLGQAPLGRGLGTTGTIGQRVFGSAAITTENWYLAIALEIGVVPALLFIASSVGVGIEAFLSYRRVQDVYLKRIALTVVGGSLGFLILGNMLSVWEVPVISMAFWLLAGVAVGARETEAVPEYGGSR